MVMIHHDVQCRDTTTAERMPELEMLPQGLGKNSQQIWKCIGEGDSRSKYEEEEEEAEKGSPRVECGGRRHGFIDERLWWVGQGCDSAGLDRLLRWRSIVGR
jgi:hypothetical protein